VNKLLVLCYHAISPSWEAGLSVTPEAFERQIVGLRKRGYAGTTFADVVEREPSEPTVVVTFDDAFQSVKTYAAPILHDAGYPATVFAPTDYVSARSPLAWPGLDHWLRTPDGHELASMGWEDLGELMEDGWEIGSHSRRHPMLSSLDDDTLMAELAESRQTCGARLGRPATTIAYPYGDTDARVQRHAEHAGYSGAAALEWQTATLDRFRFPRVGIYHKDTWARFRLKVGPLTEYAYATKLLAKRSLNLEPPAGV